MKITCETNGHIFNWEKRCIFCHTAKDTPAPICTRNKGHEGPCNGWPSEDCKVYEDLNA